MSCFTQSKDNIWVAAHRGWSEKYPENTMVAFKAAVELGVDQIETDIRITKDGELVIIHDATVDRTTNGSGKVCEMTLAELRDLDAGIKKGSEFAGEKIPTFIEFMDYVKTLPEMTLDIELKEKSFDVCDRVLSVLDEYGFTDRCVINTFHGEVHEHINEKYGKKYRQHTYYPLNCMSNITRNPFEYAYCCCMFRGFYDELNMARKEEFEIVEKMGVQPWAGACVKDEVSVDAAIERGATLITCNNPDVVLELLREKGKHK